MHMARHRSLAASVTLLAALGHSPAAPGQPSPQPSTGAPTLVTPDNFVRAETDRYFSGVVRDGGFGTWYHVREPAPVEQQPVIRLNRDTLYSSALFDLDAGPVTITLPDAGGRFMSLQIINQDHYALAVHYRPGSYTLTRQEVGTRYVVAAVRTLVDPGDPADLRAVHALQDAIEIRQQSRGTFEVPNWDQASLDKIRSALLVLASTLPDTRGMYGTKDEVEPVRFLIGAAQGWGANPPREALYLNVVPARNDGSTVYRLRVREVPVDGFWSISVYNQQGYFEPNRLNAYSLNNVTAKRDGDGAITVQFGGCDGQVPNCLPAVSSWNYMVRLYRPRPEILNGAWRFPEAQPAE
jgi:hypothetical protein